VNAFQTALRSRLRSPRSFGLLVLLLVGAGLRPAPAYSQDDFGSEADTTAADSTAQGPAARRAAADSTNARLLQSLHPTYDTDYIVARQVTTWRQNFNFGSKVGLLTFTNKTNFNIRTDSGTEENVKDGSNVTTLSFAKVPIDANLNLQRTSLDNPRTRHLNDNLALSLSSRGLRQTLWGVTHKFTFSGGLNHRGDEQLDSKSTDSGLNARGRWDGDWGKKWLKLNGFADLSRTQKNSKLVQPVREATTVPRDTTITSPTANVNRMFDIKVHVAPWSWLTSDLGANSTLSDDESYNTAPIHPGEPPSRQLEHRSGTHRTFTTRFAFFPTVKAFNLSLDLTKDLQNLDYSLRKDFAYKGDQFNWRGALKAKWQRIDIESSISSAKNQLDRATSTGQDTYNNIFDGKLSRRLSPKFSARVGWEVRVNKYFFDDLSLDRDERRIRFAPALTYNPSKKWAVNLSYAGANSRRVEQNPSHALQTNGEDNYSVTMGISYQLSQATHLSQNYAISAVYTTFDFNPSGDQLLSTQTITTNLDTQLGPLCDWTLTYGFRLTDSGPFRTEADGTRVFARDSRRFDQDLDTSLKYRLNSWATFLLDSGFHRNDNVNEYTELRTVSRDLSLQTGINVEKTLRGSVAVRAACRYIQSNTRDAYWNIDSSLKKDF
jgi:hypothetical protein